MTTNRLITPATLSHFHAKFNLSLVYNGLIIAMSKALNIETIAEGVESNEEYEILKAKGCDNIQGYYISKPIDHKAFEELLHTA